MNCLRFSVDGQRYAMELVFVRKVLPSVWINPLQNCPRPVIGVINFQGLPIPVVDLRKKLDLPEKSVSLADRFIWIEVAGWNLILVVDQVEGVERVPAHLITDSSHLPSAPAIVKGLVALPDGLLLIQDPAALLELQEREAVQHALAQARS